MQGLPPSFTTADLPSDYVLHGCLSGLPLYNSSTGDGSTVHVWRLGVGYLAWIGAHAMQTFSRASS